MADTVQLMSDLTDSLIGLAEHDEPSIDLVTLTHLDDNAEEQTVEYARRTEDTNIVTVGFDDNTVYELAVSNDLYDRLKSTFETMEDFQDVINETVIDEDPVIEE